MFGTIDAEGALMGFEGGFTDGAPTAALALAAQRCGVTVERSALKERFFAHAAPHSLRALVEIAAELGLGPRAFKAEAANLDEIVLPAIVHLTDPHREESGFALMLERDAATVTIVEGTGDEEHKLSRSAFNNWWTGVVVSFQPGVTQQRQLARAGLLWRVGRWFRGGNLLSPPQELAGRVALVLWFFLALLAVARVGRLLGPPTATAVAIAMLLVATGTWAGQALFGLSYRTLVPSVMPRLAASICKRGKRVDCDGVLGSRYSSIGGVDLSSLALSFFLTLAAQLTLLVVIPAPAIGHLLSWIAIMVLLALPASLWLIGVQIYPLRRFCPLCMTAHGAIIGLALLGALQLWCLLPRGLSLVPVAGFALLSLLLGLTAFALVVPFLGLLMEVRASRTRLAWVGVTPLGALAEMVGRPRERLACRGSALRLGNSLATFQVEALVHPMCPGCGPVIDKLARLVDRHGTILSVAFHVPQRDLLSVGDRVLCVALHAVARQAGGPRALELLRMMKVDAMRAVDQSERGIAALLAAFQFTVPDAAALAAAEEEVKHADALYEALQRGTPAVLLGGKPWESSVEDLDLLISQEPDLVVRLLRLDRQDGGSAPQGLRAS